jgi:inhibitor of KinA
LDLIPNYIAITNLIGELVWDEPPSDMLLSRQLGYKKLLEQDWSGQLREIRIGFTRISLFWKKESGQIEFKNSFPKLSPVSISLSDKIWEVPVCYQHEFGPDLMRLAEEKQLSLSQFIDAHCAPTYRIHFFGFLPGFFYLNGLTEILHTPRKAVPNLSVPKGSLAIGGTQTGIYPGESPGGWHIIGRTPLSLFNAEAEPPVWAKAGDQIRFVPISIAQFHLWPDTIPKPIGL